MGGGGGAAAAAAAAARPKKRHRSPSPEAAAAAAEFDGLKLHPSSKSPTGYMGVTPENSRFRARYRGTYIGAFDTAVEAAVAYAKYVQTIEASAAAAAEEEGRGGGGVGDGGRGGGGGGRRAAEGLTLHLSESNATGYKGVTLTPSGRFQVTRRTPPPPPPPHPTTPPPPPTTSPLLRYQAMAGWGGEKKTLGCFDTAVEAAVAYAREVGPPKPPKAEQSQEVVAEAEGLTLHLSESNGTATRGSVRRTGGTSLSGASTGG